MRQTRPFVLALRGRGGVRGAQRPEDAHGHEEVQMPGTRSGQKALSRLSWKVRNRSSFLRLGLDDANICQQQLNN